MSSGPLSAPPRGARVMPLGAVPLIDLSRHGAAFQALASGDPALDPWLPPARDFLAAARARRARLGAADRGPLWDAVEAAALRVGAPAAARQALEALRRGAPAVVTGQQAGLLGGPVFILYKAATAIAAARALGAALGEPVVPIFWVAADDADFEEIATATVVRPDLEPMTVELDRALREPEREVGYLAAAAGRPAVEVARGALAACRHGARALELAGPIWERGRDWGEGFAACLYALLGGDGLVVVDAREPALRALARPLLARAVDDLAGFAAAVDGAGEALEQAGLGRQLGSFAAAAPLWHEEPPHRRRLAGPPGDLLAAARAILAGQRPGALWPGVALRPLVVDEVLPALARVMGPAEVAYMAQLAPAYARLAVAQPAVVPRLTATLVPAWGAALAREAGGDPAALLTRGGELLEATYRRRLPPAVARTLAELESAQRAGFGRARQALGAFGRGLDQLVDSVAAKADFQLGRLWEAAIKREKSRSEAEEPGLRHLLPFLRPDQGLQERRLALLGALALAGDELPRAALERAEEDLALLRAGRAVHHLVGIEP